ncbi:MAG: mechanosensitive ion channel family protein [Pseudomonadaceae bacterium]|nr:mechanosensitive ion channel family protein [Pseudomonadaceae bacterium]
MGSLDSHRDQFKEFLLSWLEGHAPGISTFVFDIFVVLWITLVAIIFHLILHVFIRRLLVRISKARGNRWTKALLDNSLFHRLSYILQGAIVHIQAGLWLEEPSFLLPMIEGVADQWILLFALLAFFSVLNAFETMVTRRDTQNRFPFRGLIQTVKLIASLLIGMLALATLMGKSPLILFSGLGALSAVLLLVFRDPILGLVAGIQLSANQMLSVGDWLEMPKYGADGDVIDIALTTVKVRNWDKTITTIPTYALISDSFKNWRGMTDAGGRRIKRSVQIETSSIRFLDERLLQHLKKADLLDKYLEEMTQTVQRDNEERQLDMSVRINGRRLTNVGTFRAYLLSYLKSHPDIHQKLTLLVRQLEPSRDGLPIQIYAFTNTTNWNQYEDIQSDIFDHLFAVLPEFDLRAHEAPTGNDVRALVAHNEPADP